MLALLLDGAHEPHDAIAAGERTVEHELQVRRVAQVQAFLQVVVQEAARSLQVQGFGGSVDEPSLDCTTSGRWLPARDTLELQLTRLGCSTLSVQAPAVTLATDPAGAWQIRLWTMGAPQ